MVRKLRIIGIGILILIVVLAVGRNIIVKAAVTTGVKAVTGLNMSIDKITIGMFKSLINIKVLKLYNPKGFEDKIMVDIPEIHVDYSLKAFLKKKVHLQEVRLHLKEFVVVKNKDGQLNLDSLQALGGAKAEEPPQEQKDKTKKEKEPMPDIKIDILKLKIEKVFYKDYSQGDKPSIKEFNVNIDTTYENITDPKALVNLIVVKALANTTISSLTNFDLGPLAEGLKGSVKGAGDLFSGLAGDTLNIGKDVGSTAGGAVKKTADKLKKLLPFGN